LIAVCDDIITYLEPAAQLIAYARKKGNHHDPSGYCGNSPITIKVEL
jgi:hypothetical protein